MDRFKSFEFLDPARIAEAVEGTRFPTEASPDPDAIGEEASILRAADLIGQLGDPNYIRKANALYHEFEEAGLNRQLGYDNPADLVDKYPQFYWNSVAPHVQTAIRYLNVTVERTAVGRQPLRQRLPRRAGDRAQRAAEVGTRRSLFGLGDRLDRHLALDRPGDEFHLAGHLQELAGFRVIAREEALPHARVPLDHGERRGVLRLDLAELLGDGLRMTAGLRHWGRRAIRP